MTCHCGRIDLDDFLDWATSEDGTQHTRAQCVSLRRCCTTCGTPLVRTRDDGPKRWAARRRCSRKCNGKRGTDYDELRFLLEAGQPVWDALKRAGAPTAEAAYQWARRHGDTWLMGRVRAAYVAGRRGAA